MPVERRCPWNCDASCGSWCGMFVEELGECSFTVLASAVSFFVDIYWRKFVTEEDFGSHAVLQGLGTGEDPEDTNEEEE
ncbi:hypothetical protein [Candidatus Caldatribacterium sp.]|uniref:hypothetical protein n=1 Tax=Candidatus Caldatribacterium sp. TaxID=2282143 RepID=UPI00384788C6|nr:hypothetical protein [Candidatus Caldatribacterium sp.]